MPEKKENNKVNAKKNTDNNINSKEKGSNFFHNNQNETPKVPISKTHDKSDMFNTNSKPKNSNQQNKTSLENIFNNNGDNKNKSPNLGQRLGRTAAEKIAPNIGGKVVDRLTGINNPNIRNKKNLGKNFINNNNKISTPATTPLNEEKKKNDQKLQEQIKKNAVRSVANAFFPKIGGKAVDLIEQAKKKAKGKEASGDSNSSLNDKTKTDKKDKMFSLDGTINLKKALKILIPSVGVFVIILAVIFLGLSQFSRFNDLVGVGSAGLMADVDSAAGDDENLKVLYNKILDVQKEYSNNQKVFSADLIAAVYHILTERVDDFTSSDMSEDVIREIANYMFDVNCIVNEENNGRTCIYTYSESTFKDNLTNYFFPKYLSAEESSKATEEVFEYLETYRTLVGANANNTTSSNGSCNYTIPGFVIGGSVRPVNLNVSNIQFRSMQSKSFGGILGQPTPGENLVDFEKYVLGVTYGEFSSGNSDAEKAQLIAARSYALARPTAMGNGAGRSLIQEGGQWILSLCNSVDDQVYCDPDLGCSHTVTSGQNSQIYSGVNNPITYKPPLGADAQLRVYASEVNGVVLTDNNDNIIYTPYTSTLQNDFKAKGAAGWDYVSILLSHYASLGATKVKQMGCEVGTSGTGTYASWKQSDPNWAKVNIGSSGKNIGQIGCLVTSIAIQIAKSGVATTINGEFNPGTFVQALNRLNSFSGGGALQWAPISSVVPGFSFSGRAPLAGLSKSEKLAKISELLNQGYYLVAEVKGNVNDSQHWVAVESINGENITMMDPGSQSNNMWSTYNWEKTSAVSYFRVS